MVRQTGLHWSQFPRREDSCIGSSMQSSVYRQIPEDPQENMKRDIRTQEFSCTGTKVAGVPESLTPRTALEMHRFPQPMHSSQESGHSRIVNHQHGPDWTKTSKLVEFLGSQGSEPKRCPRPQTQPRTACGKRGLITTSARPPREHLNPLSLDPE